MIIQLHAYNCLAEDSFNLGDIPSREWRRIRTSFADRGDGNMKTWSANVDAASPDAFIQEKIDGFARGDYGKPSSANLQRN